MTAMRMGERTTRRRNATLCAWLALAACARASAEPPAFFGGRLRLAGEASGTIAPEDEGYFNYGDYQTDSLRLLRLDLGAELALARPLSLLADVRSDNLGTPRLYALYLRLSPWASRAVDLQAGLVPPVIGAFPRRRYAADNPLPSLPLAYQYLTNLRYDALPQRAEDVVSQRGRGWLVSYPLGDATAEPGLPLASGERWDTGVELRLGREPVAFALALTQGSPSRPQVRDDNGGKQLSARLAWSPGPALSLGVSAASGEFVSRAARAALPAAARRAYRQQLLAVDASWARGAWIVRAEALLSRWDLPALLPTRIEAPLAAVAAFVEARYKVRPGLFAAARVERFAPGEIASALGRTEWDAPVTRLEVGAGFTPARHVLLKTSWQHNRRDGGRVRANDLAVAQVVLWF